MSAFELTAEHVGIQLEARAVAEAVAPFAREADEASTVHAGVHRQLASSRLWELVIPSSHGGRSPTVDPLSIAVAREQLMAISSHADSLFALQGIGSFAITAGGTAAQKDEWLPRVLTGEALAALALTEPDAGSDLKAITTELVADGDCFRLSGAKSFISNAGAAAFYSVLARDGDAYTMALVAADSAGLTVTSSPALASPHVLGDVVFDDVRIVRDAILGQRGGGFDLVMATLSVFRVSVAGASIGLAQAALDECARHASTRRQFGRPLARLGPIAELLADSWAELEAARLLTYRAGTLAGSDPTAALHHSSMAKLLASETAGRIVDRAVQIMGRWGLIKDSKIERLTRQARPMRIYEGASQVLRLGIARALIDELGATEA